MKLNYGLTNLKSKNVIKIRQPKFYKINLNLCYSLPTITLEMVVVTWSPQAVFQVPDQSFLHLEQRPFIIWTPNAHRADACWPTHDFSMMFWMIPVKRRNGQIGRIVCKWNDYSCAIVHQPVPKKKFVLKQKAAIINARFSWMHQIFQFYMLRFHNFRYPGISIAFSHSCLMLAKSFFYFLTLKKSWKVIEMIFSFLQVLVTLSTYRHALAYHISLIPLNKIMYMYTLSNSMM